MRKRKGIGKMSYYWRVLYQFTVIAILQFGIFHNSWFFFRLAVYCEKSAVWWSRSGDVFFLLSSFTTFQNVYLPVMFKLAESKTFQVDIYHTINVKRTKISKKICYKTCSNCSKGATCSPSDFLFRNTFNFSWKSSRSHRIQTDSESKRILYISCYLKSVNLLCAL